MYRGGRSTTDLMFALRMIQEKTWEYNKKAYISFIDLKKAFDYVPREKMWRVLERDYEVIGRLIKAVRSTYVNSISKIRTGYKNEEWFEVKTGVRQGSVLSPILFIAYLDTVIRGVKESLEEIDGDIMVYADDLACWSGDGERLRQMVLCFAEKLREAGLNMNVEKTEIMIVSREEEEELIVEVDGREIKNVDRYKYLGSTFGREGGCAKEITSRIEQYGRTVRAVYPILKDKYMNKEVKRAIYEGVLTPILLYGCLLYTSDAADERSSVDLGGR